jgi:hypothetical protein
MRLRGMQRYDGVQLRNAASETNADTNADDSRVGALCSKPRVRDHGDIRTCGSRRSPRKRCAKPGNRVMKHATWRIPKGVALVGDPFLNPSWEEEAEACSAAGRGREGVETVSERASW